MSYLKLALAAAAGGAITYWYIKRSCPCSATKPASTIASSSTNGSPVSALAASDDHEKESDGVSMLSAGDTPDIFGGSSSSSLPTVTAACSGCTTGLTASPDLSSTSVRSSSGASARYADSVML